MANFVPRLAGSAVAVGILGSGLAASLYNVDAGHRAIIFDRIRGVLPVTKDEEHIFEFLLFKFHIILTFERSRD